MRLFAIMFFIALAGAAWCAGAEWRSVMDHNDVIYRAPAREGWEGLPLGNGTLGAQAWQPDRGMTFQLNTPLSGIYGGALGRVRVCTTPIMSAGITNYRQRLSLAEATLLTDITTATGKVRASAFIPADQDVLVVQFADSRTDVKECLVELEDWHATAKYAADGDRLLVTDVLRLGGGQPEYRYALAASVEGAASEAVEKTALRLRVAPKSFTLWVAVAGSRDPKDDVAALANAKLDAAMKRGLAGARAANAAWWAKFWQQSFITLSSEDGTADYMANLWYMHIYAMGAGSRGEVPPKFNGGLWLDNKDEREWGTGYWHWNTQETYWPLYAANHLELLAPYYKMYAEMRPKVEKQTQDFFGVDGAHYEETIMFDGGYSSGKGPKVTGVHPRLPTPKNFGATNMILSSSAEIAMQFWWNYLYTGDEKFLREQAYPLMKSVGQFYLHYLEKDDKGHYIVYPSNAHETFYKVLNPATDLAAIRYLFPTLIQASQRLNVDAELRPIWQDRLEHLAPYATNPRTGAILPYEPRPGENPPVSNGENPDLFPIGVFPLITLGSPDYELGVKTFRGRRNVNVYGWTTDSIAAARLGLADDLAPNADPHTAGLQWLLPDHAVKYQDHPSGLQDYYPRKPAIHPYLEGSGTFATGLGEMLLQSWNGVIRVCPALPKAWNATFKLLAMGGFEVTAQAEKGKVTALTILSQRGGPLRLVNPFGMPAIVMSSGKKVENAAPDQMMVVVLTEAGKTYTVTPAGQPARPITAPMTPNTEPKHLAPNSQRWIGKPADGLLSWQPPVEPNAPQPPTPVTVIDRPAKSAVAPVRVAAAPVIDGALADPAWKAATSLGPFFQLGKTAPARQQTDVQVSYDDQNLYLGFTCWESHMEALLAECQPKIRDGMVFTDDSVEVFIQAGTGAPWHFAVNSLGAMYDARGLTADSEDPRVNAVWKVATSRHSNRWVAEIAIPFDTLAADLPATGESWGINICRNERPAGETSTWAPLSRAAFHLPDEFGRLTLPGLTAGQQNTITDVNLLGRWTFAETGGMWARDVSGHRHAGMLTSPMKRVEGKTGKALEFTGDGFVEIPAIAEMNVSEALTMAVWVYPTAVSQGRLIDKGLAGNNIGYMLDLVPNNRLRVVSNAFGLQSTDPLPLKQWSHVAVTYGGGFARLYLNGQLLVENKGVTGKISATDLPLRLGADSGGGSRFVGLLADVRVYKRALTPEEIAALAALTQ
ncbi:MAG: LamG-like jellyroll fold domain-containing protein [Armatimonadota bacterium]